MVLSIPKIFIFLLEKSCWKTLRWEIGFKIGGGSNLWGRTIIYPLHTTCAKYFLKFQSRVSLYKFFQTKVRYWCRFLIALGQYQTILIKLCFRTHGYPGTAYLTKNFIYWIFEDAQSSMSRWTVISTFHCTLVATMCPKYFWNFKRNFQIGSQCSRASLTVKIFLRYEIEKGLRAV